MAMIEVWPNIIRTIKSRRMSWRVM